MAPYPWSDGQVLTAEDLNAAIAEGIAQGGSSGGGTVTQVNSGAGLSGGPITTSGTLVAQWQVGTVTSLSGFTLLSGVLAPTPPVASSITGTLAYSQLPAEVQSVPISIVIPGQPTALDRVHIPMVMSLTFPQALAGSQGYCRVPPSGPVTFTVNRLVSGSPTSFASIAVSSSGTFTFNGPAAVTFNAGDVLQVVFPTVQDANLADIGISLLAQRV